jgi:hypothetical protein
MYDFVWSDLFQEVQLFNFKKQRYIEIFQFALFEFEYLHGES